MKLLTHIKYNWLVVTDRIKTKSPAFFIDLKKIALKVGGSAVAVLTANVALSLSLPAALITVLGYIVAVCVAIAGTSQLTKE